MGWEDTRAARRAPLVLRIKLGYDDVDSFIDKFAGNIGHSGMFIRSRAPKAVDTDVKFELRLANDLPILSGYGVVRWTVPFDATAPRALHGMGIEFTRLSKDSRALVESVVARRAMSGSESDAVVPATGPLRPPPGAAMGDDSATRIARAPSPDDAPTRVMRPARAEQARGGEAAAEDDDTAPLERLTAAEILADEADGASSHTDAAAERGGAADAAPAPNARRPAGDARTGVAAHADSDLAALARRFEGDAARLQQILVRARELARATSQDELAALLAPTPPFHTTLEDAQRGLAALLGEAPLEAPRVAVEQPTPHKRTGQRAPTHRASPRAARGVNQAAPVTATASAASPPASEPGTTAFDVEVGDFVPQPAESDDDDQEVIASSPPPERPSVVAAELGVTDSGSYDITDLMEELDDDETTRIDPFGARLIDDISSDLSADALDPEALSASDIDELPSDGPMDLASFADPPEDDLDRTLAVIDEDTDERSESNHRRLSKH